MPRPTSTSISTFVLVVLVTSLAAATAEAQATMRGPLFAIDPGEDAIAYVRDPRTGANTSCDGRCRVRAPTPGPLDVDLVWGSDGRRHRHFRIEPARGERYRARWLDRSGERGAGIALIVMGGVLAVGGVVIWLASGLGAAASRITAAVSGSGDTSSAPATGLAIAAGGLGLLAVIGGIALVSFRDAGELEIAEGVRATAYLDVDADHAVVGVGGSF